MREVVNKNRYIALFFLVVSFLAFICALSMFIYLKEQIIIDFTKTPVSFYLYSIWVIVPSIMGLIIFSGLCWIVIIYKEKWWIIAGVIAFALLKIAANTLMFVFGEQWLTFMREHGLSPWLLNLIYFIIGYMLITSLFMRSKAIRWYYFWFALFTILANTLQSQIGPYFYDNFSIHWLMINSNFLLLCTMLISFLLFLKVVLAMKANN